MRGTDMNFLLYEVFLEPQLDLLIILLAMILFMLGSAAIGGRQDLMLLSRKLGWVHGGATLGLLVYREQPAETDELLRILLRSLLAAWLGLGSWRIVLPVLAGLYDRTIGISARKLNQTVRRSLTKLKPKPQIIATVPQPVQPETDTERQAREQRKRESELQARILREAEADARRRREESRLRCDLLYERHARQLSGSFRRERFEQFIDRYMNDQTDPDLVEQREKLLKEMIVDSLGSANTAKFASITELATYFDARRQEIDNLPHPAEVKEAYQIQLNKQEDEALRRLIKP